MKEENLFAENALGIQTHPAEPRSAEEFYQLGVKAAGQKQLEKAAAGFRQAIKLKPGYIDALNYLGIIYLTQGRLNEASACFDQVLILKPDHAGAYFNLGCVLYDQNRIDEAVSSLRMAVKIKPDYVEAHYNLGNFFMAQGKLDDAVASFRQALVLKPDYTDALCNLGVIYNEFGRKDDAVSCFKKALSLKPDHVMAFKGLSRIVKFNVIDDLVRTMVQLFDEKELPLTDRKDLAFGLGNVFENLGEYEKAFHYYREANRLKRSSFKYTTQMDQELFSGITRIFSADFFAAHQNSGCQDKTPIFILGMPRSGTTLVEQIMASHPLVFGAGELATLKNLINNICTGRQNPRFPECIPDLDGEALQKLGSDYIAEIREYSGMAQYITDKMPDNFLRVGLIRTILPNAKVIHCIRNPVDTCLSIFKMDFTGPHGYAYDLVELGRYYNLYQDIMAYWEETLPGFMYPLRYEDIVSHQELQTRKLLEFCGLPWDENCLSFYKTERRVSTASLAQVRQPIYTDSVELWKRYEKQLEPLRKIISF